jgi:predicted HicB family RNase H-like nuclease
MNLEPYIDSLRHQLEVAAEGGGDDARALAERLVAPLEAAVRLTVQDALAAAADEITLELAPGSVELRLRGREPQFVVSLPPAERSAEDVAEGEAATGRGWRAALSDARTAAEGDDAAISRINLRLPDSLKSRVEQAASSEGLSVNAWLVRAAAAALERTGAARGPERRTPTGAQRYTGWAR